MPVSPARATACEILMRIETTDAYASEMLHSARVAKLSPADHGLVTELVMGVLRWRGVLDLEIAERASQSLTKLDREVLIALRLGAYQLLFLDRIPRHAAINESVELVKRARKRSAAGMVNAVLRKIADTHVSQNLREPARVELSHPRWMVERWERIYGAEIAKKICAYDQVAPETVVRAADSTLCGSDSLTTSQLASGFGAEGIQFEPGKLLSHASVVKSGDITRTKAFREHSLVIQDEASQLVALLVGTGKAILDCCAAPGGKTRIIAERNPSATVIAMDLHPHRARLIRKLVSETNVQLVAGNVRQMPFAKKFDRVLVDAPCSGTGTLARNPEIKWRLTPDDLMRLQAYQIEILTGAMQHVDSGGQVVYSTCSLEGEENESVVEKVIATEPTFQVVDCRAELQRLKDNGELLWGNIDSLSSGPYLRTVQGVHPCDGFFAAILQKA